MSTHHTLRLRASRLLAAAARASSRCCRLAVLAVLPILDGLAEEVLDGRALVARVGDGDGEPRAARHLLDVVDDSGAPVTAGARERYDDLAALWSQYRASLQQLTEQYLQPLNAWAKSNGVPHILAPITPP